MCSCKKKGEGNKISSQDIYYILDKVNKEQEVNVNDKVTDKVNNEDVNETKEDIHMTHTIFNMEDKQSQ